MQRMFRRSTSQRESPVVEDYNFAATDEMGIRMGRPPFLHYVSSGMRDNIGADRAILARLPSVFLFNFKCSQSILNE